VASRSRGTPEGKASVPKHARDLQRRVVKERRETTRKGKAKGGK
jgi:hypothetical protein